MEAVGSPAGGTNPGLAKRIADQHPNEQVIRHTSPASGQRALGKWRPTRSAATTHHSSSEKLPIRLPNITLTLDMILAVI